jgi:Holliday junction resolvasome RuvABC endonuclease subunit
MAIEQPFVAKNAKSAFAIGRAQAIAILAAANSNLSCFEYTPREIKQTCNELRCQRQGTNSANGYASIES